MYVSMENGYKFDIQESMATTTNYKEPEEKTREDKQRADVKTVL